MPRSLSWIAMHTPAKPEPTITTRWSTGDGSAPPAARADPVEGAAGVFGFAVLALVAVLAVAICAASWRSWWAGAEPYAPDQPSTMCHCRCNIQPTAGVKVSGV